MISSSEIKECYLFFGVSGAGKSTTINKICKEEKCKEGDGETSETQNCKLVQVDNKSSIFHGKCLLDMQGYNDTRPDQNQGKIFEMTKLYFMGSNIKRVKCIIFVINMSDAKTNFYLRFIDFFKQLFTEEQITNNIIALLTKSDRLSTKEREKKLANIKQNILEIENRQGYTMEIVEWSNEEPLPDQEHHLLVAISKKSGFDPAAAMKIEQQKIDDEVQRRYEAAENIQIVKHEPKMEMQDFSKDEVVDEFIPIQCDEVIEKEVPATTETRHIDVVKIIHFDGHMVSDEATAGRGVVSGLVRLGGLVGTNYLACGITGRQVRSQKKNVTFDDPVISVRLDKSADDIHLMDKIGYTICSDRKTVTINAEFSWGGSVVMAWDFDLTVTATVEKVVVLREKYIDKVAVSKQRIEKVTKTVTKIDKKMVEIAPAYEEKVYRRTVEEIRKALIDDRILQMT